MSDADSNGAGPGSRPPSSSDTLDTLALAEMLAEMRAAGDAPRLSALLAALPDAAGLLADATMAQWDDAAEEAEEAEEVEEAAGMAGEAGPPAVAPPDQLSPGTQRGIASIFARGDAPSLDTPPEAVYRAESGRPDALALVAEAAASYSYEGNEGDEGNDGYDATTSVASSVLALAQEQGLDAATLAGRIMLSPEALRWLDQVALPLEQQPGALVFHLVGALGIEQDRVRAALAHGNPAVTTADLMDMLSTAQSLASWQRAYWTTLLTSSE